MMKVNGANVGLTLSQSYDPYGSVIYTHGGDSVFGYTGEQQAQSLGDMVYLRARYYAPTTGTFLSKDTWEGNYIDPISYAKWLYGRNNPIKFSDPSGLYYGNYVSNGSIPWTFEEKFTVESALSWVGEAYANAYNRVLMSRFLDPCFHADDVIGGGYDVYVRSKIDPLMALWTIHGGQITFEKVDRTEVYWGQAKDSRWIEFTKKAKINDIRFITHEIGHAFENAMLGTLGRKLGRSSLPNELIQRRINCIEGDSVNGCLGFGGPFMSWTFSDKTTDGEIFADMFVGWVFNRWEKDIVTNKLTDLGIQRKDFMENNMDRWIYRIIDSRQNEQ